MSDGVVLVTSFHVAIHLYWCHHSELLHLGSVSHWAGVTNNSGAAWKMKRRQAIAHQVFFTVVGKIFTDFETAERSVISSVKVSFTERSANLQ